MEIRQWINCHLLGDHDWTCAAEEGIPPTHFQRHGGLAGFMDYAKMYCRACGKVYKESERVYAKAKEYDDARR
jgi:hypothetical protein